MAGEAFESAAATVASKVTYAGAGTSVAGWILSSEFGVLAGLVIGVVGLIVNIYFKVKKDRRETAEHKARMAKLSRDSYRVPLGEDE